MATDMLLSRYLINQYRVSCNLPNSIIRKLDMNCLEINDADLSADDVSPLCSFLLGKEVRKYRNILCMPAYLLKLWLVLFPNFSTNCEGHMLD